MSYLHVGTYRQGVRTRTLRLSHTKTMCIGRYLKAVGAYLQDLLPVYLFGTYRSIVADRLSMRLIALVDPHTDRSNYKK